MKSEVRMKMRDSMPIERQFKVQHRRIARVEQTNRTEIDILKSRTNGTDILNFEQIIVGQVTSLESDPEAQKDLATSDVELESGRCGTRPCIVG
jgi:hypothetical protein